MTSVDGAVRDVLPRLDRRGVRAALVGGLAVSVRTEPRFTRDVDLAIAVEDDRAAEALVHELRGEGYVVRAVVEQEERRRLATVRLLPPGVPEQGAVVDLLFASSGVEPEIVGLADRLEVFPAVLVPVARTGHLVATKLLSKTDRRPQDAADLEALRAHLTPDETELARTAVALIEQRGYARGRSLGADLAAYLTAAR